MDVNITNTTERTDQNMTADERAKLLLQMAKRLTEYYWTLLNSMGVAISCMTVLSLVANVVIFIVYMKSNSLRRIHDKMLFCLTIANISLAVLTPLYTAFLFIRTITYDSYACLFVCTLQYGSIRMAALVNFGMSLERFVCIRVPYLYGSLGNKHIGMYLGISLVIVVASWIVPVFFIWLDTWDDLKDCRPLLPKGLVQSDSIVTISLTVTAVFFHMYVIRTALAHKRKIGAQQQVNTDSQATQTNMKTEFRRTITILIMIATTCLCWTPLHIFELETMENPMSDIGANIILRQILYCLFLSNSMFGPVIYVWRNLDFKHQTLALFGFKQRNFS